MTSKPAWGLHWFRRDLRIAGNETLRENWKRHQGRVLGVFFFDSTFLSREDFSHNRFGFFLKTLRQLREELRAQGGDLLVIDGLPGATWPKLLQSLAEGPLGSPSLVSWGRDYEPFARERDANVEKILQTQGIATFTARDHLILEPHEVRKAPGEKDFYQVFTPYSRKWLAALAEKAGQERIQRQDLAKGYFERARSGRLERIFLLTWDQARGPKEFPFKDSLDEFETRNAPHITIPLPDAGFSAAFENLLSFKDRVLAYQNERDFPALEGTSRLSYYLKNGSLVPTQILNVLGMRSATYVKEIAWREFYYSILFHRPDVESHSFLPQYRDLRWENNRSWFTRWQEGTTGFPIVDAGMRELRQTGWMHNRVRMIVASFLTKDLLIDWRWGENHFMKELLDGDLAANNGGWQWAASTGCDPQPYFRIFNPWSQSEKFDPDGDYIKRFVPELADAPAKALHKADIDRSAWKYPEPMVRHEEQRMKALAMYQAARKQ